LPHFALVLRLGDFNVDFSPVDLLLAHELDGVVSVFFGVHLDETVSERAWTTGDDVGADYFSSSSKFGSQFSFLGLEGKISNEYFSSDHIRLF